MDEKLGILLAAALVTMLAWPCRAQDNTAVIDVTTNADDADLYVDGIFAGKAGVRRFIVAPQVRELRLVADGGYGWSVPPLSYLLDRVHAGDTIEVALNFPYYYRLESAPAKAGVFVVGDGTVTRLGQTPTTFESGQPLTGTLEFRLDGFRTASTAPGRDIWNLHSADLQPLSEDDPSRLALSPPSSRRKWIDYAAIGSALVAGALAVHFKFEADRRYDRYRETGDPTLRDGVQRYDIYSGVALGVMQAGFGLFAIRLVLR